MRYSIMFNGNSIGWVNEENVGTLNFMEGVELVPITEDTTTVDEYIEVWVYGIELCTYKVLSTDKYGMVLANLEEGVGSKIYRLGELYEFRGEFYVLVGEEISFGSQGYKFKRIDTGEFTKLI